MSVLANRIEAILFVYGESMTFKRLAQLLSCNEDEIQKGLTQLDESLTSSALHLLHHEDSVQLVTQDHFARDVESLVKEEISRDLSHASTETLAVIVYQGPLSKHELDYIRGVNSGYILRSLLIRGLIEKKPNPKDRRTHLYQPTIEFLKFLGIGRIEELPDYGMFKERLSNFVHSQSKEEES